MTTGEKYSKVLEIRRKKAYKAEDEIGFGRNTLSNAIRDNREMSEDYHNRFMTHFHVSPEWWKSGQGEVFLTSVPETSSNTEMQKDNGEAKAIKDLIENNPHYRLIPTIILDEYKIVHKTESDERTQAYREALDAKNKLIQELEQELAEIRSGKIVFRRDVVVPDTAKQGA